MNLYCKTVIVAFVTENSVKKALNSSTKLQKKFVLSHKIGFPFLYLHNKIVFT